MNEYIVSLRCDRTNRAPMRAEFTIEANSIKEAKNVAKMRAFLHTAVSISDWKINHITTK